MRCVWSAAEAQISGTGLQILAEIKASADCPQASATDSGMHQAAGAK